MARDEGCRRGVNCGRTGCSRASPADGDVGVAVIFQAQQVTVGRIGVDPGEHRPLYVPASLDRIFNRDLELAGIAKRDALGRVVDVHSLRHCHASLLPQSGVAPAVAQKSMLTSVGPGTCCLLWTTVRTSFAAMALPSDRNHRKTSSRGGRGYLTSRISVKLWVTRAPSSKRLSIVTLRNVLSTSSTV